MPQDGAEGGLQGLAGEDQGEHVVDLEQRPVQERPAQPQPFRRVGGGKAARQAAGLADGSVVEIAGAKSAERNFDAGLGVGGEVAGLVPVGWLEPSDQALGAPDGEIVLVAARKGVLGDPARGVRIDLQVSRLVPIGRSRVAFAPLAGSGRAIVRRVFRQDAARAIALHVRIGARRDTPAAPPLGELGREKVGERAGAVARKSGLLLLASAGKENIEAEEIESDHRLLERPRDALRMQKGQHDLVTGAAR